MGLHDGHRARKKEQFRRQGLDGFADHEVLELLLYYAIPRKDTNEIAHRLLQKFGSLQNVFSAPLEELAKLRRPAREEEPAARPQEGSLAAALEAVFNGERPPEPEGERPRGEGEGRRRRRRGGRSEGASGGESRSQGEGQQRSRREWERRPEKPRDKEPGTAEAEGVQEGGERKPSRRRRRRPRGNRPAPGPEGNG